MNDFRTAVAHRLCATLQPRHVLLAGGRDADLAAILLRQAVTSGAVLHVARSGAPDWLRAMRDTAPESCVLHDAAAADAIGILPVPELCWVDADPNWFTVNRILRALAAQALRLGRPFPVTLVAGAGWPHARRDSYDDPAALPAAAVRPHERTGLLPGQAAPAGGSGLHRDRYHATAENEPGNGVLTAVEDFCLDAADMVRLVVLPGFGGLAALWPRSGPGQDAFAAPGLAEDALAIAAALEESRLDQAVGLQAREDALRRAEALNAALRPNSRAADKPPQALRATASRQVARARRALFMTKLVLRGRLGAWRAAAQAEQQEAAAAARLRASPLFDAAWYLARHADIAAAGDDPVLHYLRHGAAELRDPGPFFSTSHYLAQYPDVAAAGHNPLLHYLECGAAEGRTPRPGA